MITKRRKPSKFDVRNFLFTIQENKKLKNLLYFKKNRPGTLNTEVAGPYSVSEINLRVFFNILFNRNNRF